MNKTYAQTERLLQTESLDDILELSKRYCLLVGGSTAWLFVFSDLTTFNATVLSSGVDVHANVRYMLACI